MATTGNLISAPVSIKDLQQTFGRSETDLGTLIKNIVDNGIVNKWSKYKPIRYAVIVDGDMHVGGIDARNRTILVRGNVVVIGKEVCDVV